MELCIFAFDHRKQLADLALETGRDESCIPQLKLLLLAAAEAAADEAGLDGRSGILADGTYGTSARSMPSPARAGGLVDRLKCRARARCAWNMATSVPS